MTWPGTTHFPAQSHFTPYIVTDLIESMDKRAAASLKAIRYEVRFRILIRHDQKHTGDQDHSIYMIFGLMES